MKFDSPKPWLHTAGLVLAFAGGLGASDYEDTQFEPVEGPLPFEYMESPAPLPNYTPNAQWGTQGQPITVMQKPLSPSASAERLVTFPEFSIELFASEPQIVKPLWLAFDHRGRLWIAESVDYPNSLQPEGEGNDRLRIIEDTDGDGIADTFTTFTDQLSIPTSFVFADGGVIVIHSGKTEFFKDTDGDNRADESRILFTGWGVNDTHATASNLRYGFDNWIWGVVGYSGFNGTVGGKDIRFGQGIYRFKPDGSELEFIRSSNNNTWGLGLTEDNFIIGSTANGNASMYMPIPNRYYEAVSGWSAARLESIADSQRFFPITEKVRQVDWHGRYTAGSGSAIYTARQFPEEFWNRAQFVAEPTGHLMGLFFLDPDGADFSAKNARNFLASDDEWTAPIYGEVGPDGALWVVDWYNYIIQHNPTPIGFENGRGNAYETPLRDKSRGRLYRIANREKPLDSWTALDPEDVTTLLATLSHDNLLWRLHAQRLLVERGSLDVTPQLARIIRNQTTDDLGLNPGALHALWTMKGLGALEGDYQRTIRVATKALEHASASVRRAAVMTLPKDDATLETLLEEGLLSDADAQVRLATLLAIAESPSSDAAGAAVFAAITEDRNHRDRWIPDSAVAAAAQNDSSFLRALLDASKVDPTAADGSGLELPEGVEKVLGMVTQSYARRGPVDSIVATLSALRGVATPVATVTLDGLLEGWPDDVSPTLADSEKAELEAVMNELHESSRDRLLGLAERWKIPGLFEGPMDAILAALRTQVADETVEEAIRTEAARRWVGLRDTRETGTDILSNIDLLGSPTLASGLLASLGESQQDATGALVLSKWGDFTPAVKRAASATLIRRSAWASALLDAVEEERVPYGDIAPEYWSQLREHPSRPVASRARRLADEGPEISSDRAAIVERLLPVADNEGDPARGKEVYAANCAVCHVIDGEGGRVGPELTGVGSRPRADILLEILDPNRSVEANYRLWTVTTTEGVTYAGRLDAETQTTVEILDVASQKHVVQRKDIASMTAANQSLMPIGFEALPEEDLAALLSFLAQSH